MLKVKNIEDNGGEAQCPLCRMTSKVCISQGFDAELHVTRLHWKMMGETRLPNIASLPAHVFVLLENSDVHRRIPLHAGDARNFWQIEDVLQYGKRESSKVRGQFRPFAHTALGMH